MRYRYRMKQRPDCKAVILIWLLMLTVIISGCNSIGAASGTTRRAGIFGGNKRDIVVETSPAVQQSEPQPQVTPSDAANLPADYVEAGAIPELAPAEESAPHISDSSESNHTGNDPDAPGGNTQSSVPPESLTEDTVDDLGKLRELLNTYKGQHIEPHVPFDDGAISTEGYGHVEVDILEIKAMDLDTMYINLAVQSFSDNGRVAEQYIYGTADMLSDLSVEFDDDGCDNGGVLNVYFLEDGCIGVDCEITKYSSYTSWSLALEYTVLPPASE